jgi:ribonuclease Y
MDILLTISIAIGCLILGGILGFILFRYIIKQRYNQIIKEAEIEAEALKEKKQLELKEKFLNRKSELDKEANQRNQKMQAYENKLKQRELTLN